MTTPYRMDPLAKAAILFLLGSIAMLLANAQDHEYLRAVENRLAAYTADDRFDRREERIRAELAAEPIQDWAGQYWLGGGFGGTSLALAPKAGYAASVQFDFPGRDTDEGNVRLFGDHLLIFDSTERHGIRMRAEEIVRWGRRVYLVDPESLVDFANAINAGAEPRKESSGAFFLKKGGSKIPVSGRPDSKGVWTSLILEKPIQARLARVGASLPELTKYHETQFPFVIDAGRDQGVILGLEFHPVKESYIRLTVTRVEKNRSEGIGTTGFIVKLNAGDVISTRQGGQR